MEVTIQIIPIILAILAAQGGVLFWLSRRVSSNHDASVQREDALSDAAHADRKRIDELNTRHFDLVSRVSSTDYNAKEMILATDREARARLASEAIVRATFDDKLETRLDNLSAAVAALSDSAAQNRENHADLKATLGLATLESKGGAE